MSGESGVIQSPETYGTHEGHEASRPDVCDCLRAHQEVLRRIDALDGKLEQLMRERRRSQKVLLSMRETARRLGIDRATTLGDLIRHGRIKVVMKGTRPVIPADEIERIAREGFSAVGPAPKPGARPTRRALGKPGDSIRELKV